MYTKELNDKYEVLISVLVTVYNTEEYLRECLNSVLAQNFKDFEIIIVDDGSSDSSASIVSEFVKLDKRFKFYRLKKNVGISEARNFALTKCTGKYLIFVDSDDFLSPDYLSTLYHIAATSSSDLVCCNYYCLKNKYTLKLLSPEFHNIVHITNKDFLQLIFTLDASKRLNIRTAGYMWNKLIKNTCCKDVFFKKIGAEDEIFLAELISKLRTIAYCSKPLYFYRIRENSLSHSNHFGFKLLESRIYIHNLFKNRNLGGYELRVISSAIYQSLLNTIVLSFETGSLTISEIKKIKKIQCAYQNYSKDFLYSKGGKLFAMQVVLFWIKVLPAHWFRFFYKYIAAFYKLLYKH